MPQLTITEALAEVKTIHARIAKKQEAIMRYFHREGRMRDPLQEQGGSGEFVRKERQGIADLQERIVAIRTAIQAVNLNTRLSIEGKTRSVAAWLTWRKEVSEKARGFLGTMAMALNQIRQQALRQGLQVTDKEKGDLKEIVVAVNEATLAEEVETMEKILGELDGKLSLLNATTVIEV